MDTQSHNLTIPRGKIFFAKYLANTQTPGPLRELGNCPEFTLQRETEKLQHYSSQAGMKTLDEEITIGSTMSGSTTTDDIKAENVAYWFMGDISTLTVIAQTATVETFSDVKAGDSFQLGRTNANPTGARKLTNVVATDGAASSPATYALGTDYEIDLQLGIITVLAGGAADGEDLKVTYDVAASTREQIIAGDTEVEGELKFISFNPTGPQADITIPRARISPNGDFALVNDPDSTEFQTMPLSISVLKKGTLALAYRDGRPA